MQGIQKSFRIDEIQFEHAITAMLDMDENDAWVLGADSVCYFCGSKAGVELPVLGAITFTPSDEGMVCDIVCEDQESAEFIYEQFNSLEGMGHEAEDLAVCEVGAQAANG